MTMNSLAQAASLAFRRARTHAWLRDLLIVAALVTLDVVARVSPHAPNFTPVAASALFAASVLRLRALSLLVPIAGMWLGDAMHGFYDWRVMAAVYAALSLPACAACMSRRLRAPRMIVPVMLSCSLTFFLLTNFAVWAFGAMYDASASGLIACYVAALPFLKYTIGGDLFWAAALFGGFRLLHNLRRPSMVPLDARHMVADSRP